MIINGSFEVPTGTTPSLTSGGVEPFALIDGTYLDVELIARGGFSRVHRWYVDAADFADVGAATAYEVRNAFNASAMVIIASSSGGRVTLIGGVEGSMLRVLGGHPQTVLLFPTTPAAGTSLFGPGQLWAVVAASAHLEYGGFGSTPELPAESFEAGWGAVVFATGDMFNDDFEDGWTVLFPSGSLEAGAFLGGALVESFEDDWDSIALGVGSTTAVFSPGAKSVEDFEDDWVITSVATPTSFSAGLFNDGADAFENFENAVAWTHVITVVAVAEGPYVVEIGGVSYVYNATLLDTLATIGQGLVDDINAGTQMGAAAVNPFVVTPTPRGLVIPTVVVHGPTAGSISVVLAPNSPTYVDQWVGQDLFPEL